MIKSSKYTSSAGKIKIVRTPELTALAEKVGAHQLPIAQIQGNVKSLEPHPMFPLMVWVKTRPNESTTVMVQLAILNPEHTETVGYMSLSLPFSASTERYICALLEDFGWDGRVSPGDDGWPLDSDDEKGFRELLGMIDIAASLTFPPKEDMSVTLWFNIESTVLPFVINPYRMEETEVRYLEKLRELAANPVLFQRVAAAEDIGPNTQSSASNT